MELHLMFCETEDGEGNPAIFSHSDPDPALGDIPASLASYFETSESRAAACERLILEQLEDDYAENKEDFAANIRQHLAERGNPHREQTQETETRRRREMDFQEELRRNMEAEKRQQMELELRQRKAQEKLDQELLLRQELIGNFKKQVEQERVMMEEEKNRRILEEVKMKQEKRKNDKEEKKKCNKIREDGRNGEREEMRRKVEQEEGKKREETEKGEVNRKKENKSKEEKGCFTVNGKMMTMDGEERKVDETKLGDEPETMEEKDDGEKRREEHFRIGSLSKGQVQQEEKEGGEEVQLQRKTFKNEMHHKDGEEKRKIDERKSHLKICLQRRKEEKRRDKEMEGQGLETATQKEEGEQRSTEEENKVKQERRGRKGYERENREIEGLEKAEDEEKRQEELTDDNQRNDDGTTGAEVDKLRTETGEQVETRGRGAEDGGGTEGKKDAIKEEQPIGHNHLEENKGGSHSSRSLQNSDKPGPQASLVSDPSVSEATPTPPATQQHGPDDNIWDTSALETADQTHSEPKPSAWCRSLPASLHERTEQKRLSWMERCAPWSELSLQNKRKQKGSFQSRRRPRRAGGVSSLAPLCPRALLQSTGRASLQEVTTVTLEDLPACGLSTLAQCKRLQRLTLRRCGLRSLEGISQLQELCYVDLEENDISSLDCENMGSLRVLRLAHNKLTSIHGLSGADSLDVLDLSHNSITRIAGLESVRRLQRLSVDHNQLISTKGLRDVYTLLHLDCSHNHLAKVEGLENSALLHTLDLRSNSLTEPPSLNNQVLLRELLLDDNAISSLQGLAACWLPLLQHLAVPQNRITQLPSMTDFVSLKKLDVSFNCLSELRDVCESLEGCLFLQEVHLTGNPLQQETDWRSKLQRAVPGLRAFDSQQTHSLLSSLASQQLSLAPDTFLMLCQVQLQQTQDLHQRLSRELRNASSSLDAMKSCCHHFALALQLAEDQRFAHEYGDTAVSEEHTDAGQTMDEKSLDLDSRSLEKLTDSLKSESPVRRPPDNPGREQHGHNHCHFEDAADEQGQDTFGGVTAGQRSKTESSDARCFVHFCPSKGERISTRLDNLARKNAAATVLQRTWRTYRRRCGYATASSTADSGGEREGHAENDGSTAGRDHAAAVIQAFWRGCALRRRLASALDALARADTGEEDTLEEVDVEEFVVDEQTLEEQWTMTVSDDPPPLRHPVTEQNLSPKVVLEPKQAWAAEEQRDSVAERYSAGGSSRSMSPASTSVHSGLSARSEQILQEWGFADSRTALLMLKRAQKMKATKPQQKKHGNPSGHVASRGCNYQMSPAEARNRPARHSRRCLKVGEAQLGLQWAGRTEQMRWQQAQQQLQAQVPLADRHSERGAFLPEINSSTVSSGRVQLMADPAYADLPSTAGPSSKSSLTAQLVCTRTLTRASKEAPPPRRVTSPVVNKERISFRDFPVQLSVGWGGGKKRDRLPK
ncbi:leucine-rich repeat and IQ domain-containing protein 1 [Fundulus heteroclitus]|uniref:leucine-rich repeat and IQ domain-containing protein 1 n=1 Tax=Fundulus heteroclitus TaxID=8078 RepID=UPI00165CA557|nr:leucine-rich repeat and IQ domain-containing protein 1 [Fundulus heteroclitus]